MSLQSAAADMPGYVDDAKLAVKLRHRHLNHLLCARCQALSNGAMIPGVEDFAQQRQKSGNGTSGSERTSGFAVPKALVTPEELRQQLRNVRDTRALVVLLIDLLDASGSVLSKVRDLVGANPIVAVGTKADLLPKGTDILAVEEWLEASLAFKRIAVSSVHLVSSKTGEGVSEAVAAVRRARLGRDVFVMGAANVGKSAFVRALVRDMSSMSSRQFDPGAMQQVGRLPVESAMPGTTLQPIPLQVFSSGGVLYDTPGLHLHHRVPHMLTPEENKELHPRKRLRGYVAPSPQDVLAGAGDAASYHWGSLAKIDVVPGSNDVQLVFYGPSALKVESGGSRSSGSEITGHSMFAEESVAARGGLRLAKETELEAPKCGGLEAVADVAISGVPGWLTVYCACGGGKRSSAPVQVRVWVPVGVEVFIRPPMPVASPLDAC